MTMLLLMMLSCGKLDPCHESYFWADQVGANRLECYENERRSLSLWTEAQDGGDISVLAELAGAGPGLSAWLECAGAAQPLGELRWQSAERVWARSFTLESLLDACGPADGAPFDVDLRATLRDVDNALFSATDTITVCDDLGLWAHAVDPLADSVTLEAGPVGSTSYDAVTLRCEDDGAALARLEPTEQRFSVSVPRHLLLDCDAFSLVGRSVCGEDSSPITIEACPDAPTLSASVAEGSPLVGAATVSVQLTPTPLGWVESVQVAGQPATLPADSTLYSVQLAQGVLRGLDDDGDGLVDIDIEVASDCLDAALSGTITVEICAEGSTLPECSAGEAEDTGGAGGDGTADDGTGDDGTTDP